MTGNPKRGGKRTGAGRPAALGERKERLTVRITPTLRAFLDSREESAAEHIEAVLRVSGAFQVWQEGRQG